MTEVKSPYNFVPAPTESEVFKPEWANQVSHDIPFSDGESGEITLKITAETPIFIRNGHSKDVEENEFSHIGEGANKRYFIPATSIKGMLRNVLEIMSFSRMKQVDDTLHSIRQVIRTKNTVIDEGYQLNEMKKDILAGYLVKKNDEYFIYDSGKPLKIRNTDLDSKFNKGFSNNFMNSVSNNFDERTGAYKYERIIRNGDLEEYLFEKHDLQDNEKQKSWVWEKQPLGYVKFSNSNDAFWGRIVCVGQASPYSVSTARRGEYVFKGKREEVIKVENKRIKVSDKVISAFLFLNRHNKNESEELKDWAFWKDKVSDGIPVFFRKDKNENIVDLGLTFMYKQAVKYSVNDLLKYAKSGKDLAECIFGCVGDDPLKGRVFISNAFVDPQKIVKVLTPLKSVLSSPKSSYIPFYIYQNGRNSKVEAYNTYQVGEPKLRGFKRYPVHATEKNQSIDESKPKLISISQPLDTGVVFIGKIRYHNLKPEEIGVLVSSLTFHNTPNTYHNLGGNRAFGYGRIKIEVNNLNKFKSYQKSFETLLRLKVGNRWLETLNELVSMASLSNDESKLSFMELSSFQEIKEQGGYLPKYSEISIIKVKLNPLSSQGDIEQLISKIKEEEDAKNSKLNKIFDLANKLLSEDNFSNAEVEYRKYKALKADFNLETTLQEIEKLKILYQLFNDLSAKNTRIEFESSLSKFLNTKWHKMLGQRIKEFIDAEKQGKLEAAQNSKIEFNANEFSKLKENLNKSFKTKGFEYSETQKVDIKNLLKTNFNTEKDKPKSEWKKNKNAFDKYPWTDVTKWLGQEKAQELYKQLIG